MANITTCYPCRRKTSKLPMATKINVMRQHYNPNASRMSYAPAGAKAAALAVAALIVTAATIFVQHTLQGFDSNLIIFGPVIVFLSRIFWIMETISLILGVLASFFSGVYFVVQDDAKRIAQQVRAGLCCPAMGNPLRLKVGEMLPVIQCKQQEPGVFLLTITAKPAAIDELIKMASVISSALDTRGLRRLAVTQTAADIACNFVQYRLEDVTVDKSIVVHRVDELKPVENTKLAVQQGTYLDLRYSGSILVAGKTRSGKTTGIISLLLQVVQMGHDEYGSQIVIIDPKRAELSRLPCVVSPDDDGGARQILIAVQQFADFMRDRQEALNDASKSCGDAVKWWQLGMKPSYIFLDEYVALRSLFPKKADKIDPDYCLETFDNVIKRIVTMGAAAGCFAIISIAEASVEQGGLPAMLRSAMTTKILFKPTMPEARLLWDTDKLQALQSDRVYQAGDAWFSSQDGSHDFPSFVHFPVLDFAVYGELGRLLSMYYGD